MVANIISGSQIHFWTSDFFPSWPSIVKLLFGKSHIHNLMCSYLKLDHTPHTYTTKIQPIP